MAWLGAAPFRKIKQQVLDNGQMHRAIQARRYGVNPLMEAVGFNKA